MDFISKKEEFADLLEKFAESGEGKELVLEKIKELISDDDFKNRELFQNIFLELDKYLGDLSRKEIKQRVLMIRSYLD